jgi:response regulator NasT
LAGIIVAFPKPEDSKAIKGLLVRNGYDVVSACTTGAKAIQLADNLGEGIIISGYRLPDMLYNEIYENVQGSFEMMLIASRQRLLEDDSGIAMIEMPIKVRDFLNSVEMMEHNLYAKAKKRRKKPGQRTAEEQSIVNQAKAVLMEKNNLSENEAHRYIQKTAMDSGRTMTDTANMILKIMYKD